MSQRYLDPEILAGISGLDLVAKTVVDGFIAGLHRSPDFGFSQEFAEYRAYSEGDDLRHVDWNVFARTTLHASRMAWWASIEASSMPVLWSGSWRIFFFS